MLNIYCNIPAFPVNKAAFFTMHIHYIVDYKCIIPFNSFLFVSIGGVNLTPPITRKFKSRHIAHNVRHHMLSSHRNLLLKTQYNN